MTNIFDSSKENSILKDERFLYPDFVPDQLPFRDAEIGEIVFGLKPAAHGKKPTNIFIAGKPGTGKTASAKFVLNELEEYSDRAKPLYINCFEINTRYAILAKATNFFGFPVPNRGLGSQEIFERFLAVIKNKKIVPILIFDEAEQLLKNEDSKKLLYDLSRLAEQFKIFAGLLFISNDEKFLSFLDERIRSSLNASKIVFEKYSALQLKEILKERAQYAFFSNVLEDEVIPLCAAHASKEGDARIAIESLLKASRFAERENAQKVSVKHVRKAFMEEKPVKFEITENLSEQEQLVLDFVAETEVSAGDLYKALCKKFAERTLRKAVSDLEKKGLLVTEKTKKGKGHSRIIRRNSPNCSKK